MKKIKLSAIVILGIFTTQSFAFDMGSMLKSAAPVVGESVAQTQTVKDSALLGSLTSLGVTPAQATGGTAALLNSAKTKMEPTQFSALTKQTPGLEGILKSSSPATSSLLGNTTVENQFKALGMDSSMIKQFTPVIINYAKGYVSPEIATALSSALAF
jgi:hypothetical protein